MGNHGQLNPSCDHCKSSVIIYRKEFVDVNYRNEIVLNVEQHHYLCTSCNTIFTTPTQKAVNKTKVMQAYHRSQSCGGWIYDKAI